MPDELVKIATANPEIVRALMEHLVKAFEEFAEAESLKCEQGLEYKDAIMGVHNFHKRIILDLEKRTGDRQFLRQCAVSTLAKALLGDDTVFMDNFEDRYGKGRKPE
jgi:hypothetical protein